MSEVRRKIHSKNELTQQLTRVQGINHKTRIYNLIMFVHLHNISNYNNNCYRDIIHVSKCLCVKKVPVEEQ